MCYLTTEEIEERKKNILLRIKKGEKKRQVSSFGKYKIEDFVKIGNKIGKIVVILSPSTYLHDHYGYNIVVEYSDTDWEWFSEHLPEPFSSNSIDDLEIISTKAKYCSCCGQQLKS